MAGKPKPKSHCNYGHAMTPENTAIVHPKKSKYPWRQCRICMDLTPAEAVEIEAKLEAGCSLRDLGLSFPKKMGLDAYRAENPEWSARIDSLSALSATKKKAAVQAQMRNERTHCVRGHELTPGNFDKTLVPDNATSWNPRACLICREKLDRNFRLVAEEIVVPEKIKISGPAIGRINRTHCKAGHLLSPENVAVIMCGGRGKGRVWRHHVCRTCTDITNEEAADILRQLNARVALKRIPLPTGKDMHSLKRYRAEHPNWDNIVTPLMKANGLAARVAAWRARAAATTHCGHGHEYTPETTYWKHNGTRACKTCDLINLRRVKPITPQKIELAKRAIVTGSSVTGIISGPNKILSDVQWSHLRRTDRTFNRFVLEHISSSRSLATMQSRMGIAPIAGLERAPQIENVGNEELYVPQPGDYEWLYSLTPRSMLKSDRDEVVSNVYMELAERRLRREDVPSRVRAMTQQHHKLFPQREAGSFNAPLSLDAPAYLDGTTLRVETVFGEFVGTRLNSPRAG
ncbi:hypothetical protein H8A95_19855 [Bradyrhizobium sp. Pear76]|uniref:hypothetical protein n=1 Tax=Bradyrhizobium oropedii TaxID=1571201 RepID=UPI001E53EE5A|nr:hypothetical protein [Bradyrhizobium oropedii]MCC8964509.1 hypothetical protein [Bradyrhizobium oropedii]